jgi:hypothetical protein
MKTGPPTPTSGDGARGRAPYVGPGHEPCTDSSTRARDVPQSSGATLAWIERVAFTFVCSGWPCVPALDADEVEAMLAHASIIASGTPPWWMR